MENFNLSKSIKNYGFIDSINISDSTRAITPAKNSTEDYVGKITTMFLPYLNQNISDGKLLYLQNEIKKIVCEIRESC